MREFKFVAGAARLIAVGGTEDTDTSMVPGGLYRISVVATPTVNAPDGGAACRWGSTAVSAADGGCDFVVLTGESVLVRCPSNTTTLRAIRVGTVSLTLLAQLVESVAGA